MEITEGKVKIKVTPGKITKKLEVFYNPVTHQAWWYGGDQFNTIDLAQTSDSLATAMVENFFNYAHTYNIPIAFYEGLFVDIKSNIDVIFHVLGNRPDLLGYRKANDPFKNSTLLISLVAQLAPAPVGSDFVYNPAAIQEGFRKSRNCGCSRQKANR